MTPPPPPPGDSPDPASDHGPTGPSDPSPENSAVAGAEADGERGETALVRPYVKTTPAPRDPADAPTVIQPAVVDDTAVLAAVPADAPSRRRLSTGRILALRMLALVGGLAAALAIAGFLIFAPKDDTTQPSTALPKMPHGQPAGPAAPASSRPSASASSSPSRSPSASPSESVSASASVSAPASAPSSKPASVTPTPPAADRTGSVTAASGRCLAMGGLFPIDGSPITVNSCANIDYQHFTLAADGTLRVSGKCAEATSDGTVRIDGCGDEAGAQWRTGASNTLVNPATGQCLTDPGSAGGTTKVTACTGAASQKWSLP